MFGLGVGEIVVILFIALIVIGPKKLPGLAKGLGKGMREFQNAAKGITDSVSNPVNEVKNEIQNTKDQLNPLKNQSQTIANNDNKEGEDIASEDGDVSPDHVTTQDKNQTSS